MRRTTGVHVPAPAGPIFGGVETGGTWTVCAVGTGPDAILRLEEFPTTSPSETLERIVAFFRRGRLPDAVGVGSFGPVDLDPSSPTWGTVRNTPKPGWKGAVVAPILRDQLEVRIAFDTDVAVAALAEHRWGAGRDVSNLVYLTVGTGVGAGLIVNGRPIRGLVHAEVGHMRVPHDMRTDPFPGACPVHGDCWEGLASGTAVAQRWRTRPEDLPADHPAWSLEATYLALGIFDIVCVTSPQRVIVGGGVMSHHLLPMVRQELRRINAGYLETPMLDEDIGSYLVEPQLGDRAGVLGAIALAELVDTRGSTSLSDARRAEVAG